MSVSNSELSAGAGYQLHLPQFEGPLDVLLRLVERNQLPITDLSLVAVLDQFLAHVAQLDDADPALIAEFTTVGSRLTLLKSRSLLPRPPVIEEEESLEDITLQLLEYKRMRDAARVLGEWHASGFTSFTQPAPRAREFSRDTTNFKLADYEPGVLWRSIRRRVSTLTKPESVLKQLPLLSIRDVIARASGLFSRAKETTFTTLVAPYASRGEVATAFLATLVLLRRKVIAAEQPEMFGEITLRQIQETATESDVDPDTEFEPA